MDNLRLEAGDQMKNDMYTNENDSEDEVFIGKMSLEEVKKRIFMRPFRKTISFDKTPVDTDKTTSSIKIIEVHSEPDIISKRENEFILNNDTNTRRISNPDISQMETCSNRDDNSPEDSFIKLEKMVANLFMSPKKEELDNTLDIVKKIPVNHCYFNTSPTDLLPEIKIETDPDSDLIVKQETNTVTEYLKEELIASSDKLCKMEMKPEPSSQQQNSSSKKTGQLRTPLFKTPSTAIKGKKQLDLHNKNTNKKTIHKFNAYDHITSPVASYIKKSQVPLVKDVCPKKPLIGSSHIPKPIKANLEPKSNNKENVILTPVAYKSAKKTKVINLPNKEKMPKSPWAEKVATALPKAFVIKHDHREMNLISKPGPTFQDSFADLSLHQAEVSVCTQKPAFKNL
ncbi:uncharacterized protein LOC123695704 [Colias croceus]|uniref:uncharacterized protein LOC123695704 n=1 Tax=Colias crocea TaxID=72248 RepID=UPI001E280736|nr:uncharacterized protein LOC123695704 [Colias croceus]